MNQENTVGSQTPSIHASLRAIAVGSYVFQSRVAGRMGLHQTDLLAIHHLGSAEEAMSAGELGSLLGLTSGATTSAIDRLVRLGIVERVRDPEDGRRVLLQIRPDASRELSRLYGEIDKRVQKAIDAVSPDDQSVIARFLQAIANENVGRGAALSDTPILGGMQHPRTRAEAAEPSHKNPVHQGTCEVG